MQRVEKILFGQAGVYPKDARHAATARHQVRNPRPHLVDEEAEEVLEDEEEGEEEPADGISLGSRDTDEEDASGEEDASDEEDAYAQQQQQGRKYFLATIQHRQSPVV